MMPLALAEYDEIVKYLKINCALWANLRHFSFMTFQHLVVPPLF